MKLGENISNLRKHLGLSQEQLGEKINVTRQTISNWELDETAPNPEQLRLLSKVFNISIDELLNNDINNVLVEKVSNTEQLAGLIIKILKILGIAFLVFFLIDVIVFIMFISTGKLIRRESSVTTICSIDNNNYQIEFGTNNYYKCDNCSDKMNNELKVLVDYNDIDESLSNIENYFKDNNGSCE